MTVSIDEAYDRLVASPGVVFLVGDIDTGKTTFGLEVVKRALDSGMRAAFVDADIGQSSVGPPTTVGLKLFEPTDEVTLESVRVADHLGFAGSLTPRGYALPVVMSTAKLVAKAKRSGFTLIVVDTTGMVSGISGQVLKYHKMDATSPDHVVAFERGGELEPIVGIAHRFTSAEVLELAVPASIPSRTAEERMSFRERQFAGYFAPGASRWRVKPTVFMPTLPPDFDLIRLDGLVVGMEDGTGDCVGIGVLEYDGGEDILRMVSPVTTGVKGLRLGSVRIDIEGRSKGPVSLRQLFGTE
jgi:polynucleotide 5'-kinase involved in rRNA processing